MENLTNQLLKDLFNYNISIEKGNISANIYDTETETCIEYPLLGIEKNEVSINLVEDILKITVKKDVEKENKKDYIKKSFEVFDNIEKEIKINRIDRYLIENITSELKNGILTINLPKKEKTKIDIKIN